MPAYTSPDNIQYPVSTDQVAPLETVFANLAQSTQNAMSGLRTDWTSFEGSRAIQTFRWANAAERTAQTGMVVGDIGLQIDTNVVYRRSDTAWVAWQSPWTTYTPTLSSIVVGSGTRVSRWRYLDGMVLVEGSFTLGAGSSVGANPGITHPVPADALHSVRFFPLGQLTILDVGVNAYAGAMHATTTNACEFAIYNAASTYAIYQVLNAAVPVALGSGDVLMWRYQYQPA